MVTHFRNRFVQSRLAMIMISMLLSVILLLLLFPTPILAEQPLLQTNPAEACNALDLVVLVDQSASMRNNDSRGLRIESAKSIIQQLGDQAVLLCPDQNVHHRIAVYGFGDVSSFSPSGSAPDNDYQEDVREYLPPQSLPPDNENWNTWSPDREVFLEVLSNFGGDNLAFTDHASALMTARDVLESWGAGNEDLGDAPRKRAIILITDGEACTGSGGCSTNPDAYVFDRSTYMSELVAQFSPQGTALPWNGPDDPNGIFLSLIVLADSNTSFNYRTSPVFRNNWEQIVGERGDIFDTNDANLDLDEGVLELLEPLMGRGLVRQRCEEPVWVVPYRDSSLILYITRTGAEEDVEPEDVVVRLITPGNEAGEEVTLIRNAVVSDGITQTLTVDSGIDHTLAGISDYYVFQRPLPGKYFVEVDAEQADICEDISVYSSSGGVKATVTNPTSDTPFFQVSEPPFYIAADRTPGASERIRVQVEDQEGPLVEHSMYPLQLTAVISNALGHEQVLNLSRVDEPGQAGVYESDSFVETPDEGEYSWVVVGEVAHSDPRRDEMVQVFGSLPTGTFNVAPVDEFNFVIEEPHSGASFEANAVNAGQQVPKPISVSVATTDQDGVPLNIDEVFSRADGILEANLYDGSEQLLETIPLLPSDTDPAKFVGEFTNTNNGAIREPGIYAIEIASTQEQADYDFTHFTPGITQDSVSFEQTEVIPLDIVISPPTDVTVHESLGGCIAATILPFDFVAQIKDLKSGTIVALEDVLEDTDSSFAATVVSPSGSEEQVSLFVNVPDGQFDAMAVGSEMDEEGEYQILLPANSYALQSGFVWANDESKATFERNDTLQTSPTVCRTVSGIGAAIMFSLLGLLIYLMTGGPSGALYVVNYMGYGREEEVAGPWRLSSSPRTNTIKNPWLEQQGIKSLSVKTASPTDPDAQKAVYVEAKASETGADFEAILNDSIAEPFSTEGEIVYRSRG